MAQANETITAKLVASLSKRVTMRLFSFSQPSMRSMMLCCRYFGPIKQARKSRLGFALHAAQWNGWLQAITVAVLAQYFSVA